MTQSQDSYFIPSSYSRIVARELGLMERDLPHLLRGTGLSTDILLPGDETRMSGRQQLRILDNGRRMLDAPDFGLRLGRRLDPSAHGPLGYLALSSPDLMTALESLRDFLPARLPLVGLQVSLDDDWLSCTLDIKVRANHDERRILQECFALAIQSIAESILGGELCDGRIELAHDQPVYHGVYDDYLHSPVEFGCARNVFRMPPGLARIPNASGDPDSYAMAQALCLRLLEQVPAADLSTGDRVRRLLLSSTPGSVTESEVASAMFVSKRTLARRLEAEGTGYRAIREKLLAELAARHLRESSLTVEAVAALLGYSDTAAFRKAFHRWYGLAPSAYRAGDVVSGGGP
jgi:AraC-like DNA-binding protein